MRRIIINLDPLETDIPKAIDRTIRCIKHYTTELGRDGERITATWDSGQLIYIYHDKLKELCAYSPHVEEERNEWFNE